MYKRARLAGALSPRGNRVFIKLTAQKRTHDRHDPYFAYSLVELSISEFEWRQKTNTK